MTWWIIATVVFLVAIVVGLRIAIAVDRYFAEDDEALPAQEV